MAFQNIKNIIFDLGNVLFDLDFDRVNQEFQKIAGADFIDLAGSDATRAIFDQFEKGLCSEETFLNAIQRMCTPVPDGRAVIDAWNSMLVGMPAHRFEMLKQLKKQGYNLYLLSNNNELHLSWCLKHMKNEHGIEDFNEQFFIKAYYSHLVNMRKPDAEIYEFVLADAFLKAEETLFIDDYEPNIIAASALGVSTIHHNSGKDISVVLSEAGLTH